MERFFRQYGSLVTVGVLVLMAVLLAIAANGLFGSLLAPYTVPEVPKWTPPKVKAGQDKVAINQDQAKTIEERCLFGCAEAKPDELAEPECPEEGCPEGQECIENRCKVPEEPLVDLASLPVLSDLNVTLTGVMVATKQPEWSSAMVLDPATQQTAIIRPGDMVLGEGEVVEIKRDRIVFKRGGRLEFVRIQNAISGDPSARAGIRLKPASLTRKPTKRAAPNEGGGASTQNPAVLNGKGAPVSKKSSGPVKRVSPGNYEVEGKAIDAKLKNKAELQRSVKIIPYYKNKKKAGLKLTQIAPNSVFETIGLRNDDVLTGVNGKKITTQAQALDLFKQMKNSKTFKIQIERRGKPQTFSYTVNR